MKVKGESEVAQSCPTLSDPMDCSPPGSSVHGIFQARVLEWGAIAFSTPTAVKVAGVTPRIPHVRVKRAYHPDPEDIESRLYKRTPLSPVKPRPS